MTKELSDTSILNICSCEELIESHPDDIAVDLFAQAMKERLAEARSQGRSGWSSQTECSNEHLSDLLRKNVADGDPVDVGNYAMMLQQRGSAVLPSSADGEDHEKTISEMRETMAAAAEEISYHWDAHCDSEGYGPVNLQRRLEGPYGVNYPGYSLGAFAKLREELGEAKAVAAEVPRLRERLDQAAESYLRLVNASCYSDRGEGHGDVSPEDWVNEVVSNREYYAECMRVNMAHIEDAKASAERELVLDKALLECYKYMGREAARLNFLVSEGLQVYEADGKFRLRQVVDACTVGKSYSTAREAIDAALTDGVSECQCKGEICE